MRGAWSTLALVAAALGLGAYIYFVDSTRPDTAAKEKVFAVEADAVEEVRIVAKGDTSVLKKSDGAWKLVEPLATDADGNEVTAFVGGLTSLELNREVDAVATDLAQYGLASPKADITFTAKGGVKGRLRLGDQTPTGTDVYAVRGDDTRVFLVSTFAETSLVRSAFDLRDKRVLRFERDKVDGLEITTAAGTTALSRTNSEWRLAAPSGARGDYGAIEGLLTRLSTTMMSGIETTDITSLQKYGLDKPVATVVVKAGSSSATLVVGSTADNKAYARDLARPMVFTVDAAFATDAQKGATDYRRKELFDFRPFSATTLAITKGIDAITFSKTKGTGDNAAEKWTVTTGAGTRDADGPAMDDLLSKLSGLRAETFVAAAPAGAATPVMKVQADFDEAKKESASISRAGADAYGARADETGAMKLTAAAVDEALKALDTVLAPPTPPAAPTAAPGAGAGAATEKKP